MRRALVLTDESARHPFRAVLPGHLRKADAPASKANGWRLTTGDIRGAASVYFTTFATVLALIA